MVKHVIFITLSHSRYLYKRAHSFLCGPLQSPVSRQLKSPCHVDTLSARGLSYLITAHYLNRQLTAYHV